MYNHRHLSIESASFFEAAFSAFAVAAKAFFEALLASAKAFFAAFSSAAKAFLLAFSAVARALFESGARSSLLLSDKFCFIALSRRLGCVVPYLTAIFFHGSLSPYLSE